MVAAVDRFFKLKQRGTTVAREARGALATFLTMAYILFVNPRIVEAAGVPFDAAVACTALAAGICSLLMGVGANFPLALASGMGLNAFVAGLVVGRVVDNWQTAMGLVVLDGLVVMALVLCGLREAVMNAIPRDLRLATGAGIGLFIAFIGAVNAGIVVTPPAPPPPVTAGDWHDPRAAVAGIGLLVMALLLARKVKGALVLGILFATGVGFFWGVSQLPEGIRLPNFGIVFQADVRGALKLQLVPVLFALLMVDFFDTIGTVTAVAEQAGLRDEKGRIPRLRNVLFIDGLSATVGGLLGVSSVTAYVESAAGVSEGARTGLHSVLVGLMFLLAVLAAPLAGVVPAAATAPALVLVGFLMAAPLTRIDFADLDTAIPAFVTVVAIPFTFSIAHGVGYGFIVFVFIKVFSGRFREVRPLMYAVAAAFAAYFYLEHSGRPPGPT